MVDVVFRLGHEFVEHIVDSVACRRLMTVRVAIRRRVIDAVVRMDIVVRIIDRIINGAEKVGIKARTGMGEW